VLHYPFVTNCRQKQHRLFKENKIKKNTVFLLIFQLLSLAEKLQLSFQSVITLKDQHQQYRNWVDFEENKDIFAVT
jgi:cell division FtsZ-interacting protein ZapD